MKFLHTSDLHIGKRMNGVSLLGDQKNVLDQIVGIAASEKCDAVIIAGDVYDKANPSAEAMALFDSFLWNLSELSAEVFIISGNHDSPQRVDYLSEFMSRSGINICGGFCGKTETYRLTDEYGDVCIHLLPFIKPSSVRSFYPEEKIETYDDAVRIALAHSEIDSSERNIIISHQFVTGAQTCDSEVFAVGGLDNISAENFQDFDYAAMGHIHGPQYVLRPHIRYSGSPLKYSFSEVMHKKSVTIAELREKGNIEIRTVELSQEHDVREVRGSMDELMEMPYSEDYVRVTATDDYVAPDARISLRTVFPNMMKFAVENSKSVSEITMDVNDSVEKKSPLELFSDFYRMMNNDVPPSEEHITLLQKIIEGIDDEK